MRVIGLGKSLKYTTSHKNRPHAKAESGVFFLFRCRPQRRVLVVRNCRGRTADKRKRCAAIRGRLFSDVHLIIRTADKSSLVQTLETLIESVHSLRS